MRGALPVHDAASMRALDARAIELGIPGIVLMERAGLAAAHELLARFPDVSSVVVACGPGANGGDGFVVARHLHAAGLAVRVLLAAPASRATGDARTNLRVLERLGLRVDERPDPALLGRALRNAGVAVDALLGTGASGAPRTELARFVERLNAAGRPLLSLDVPSGVDASSGAVAGAAVEADVTVTFHAPKAGLLVAPGRGCAGAVVVADIGIPPDVEEPTELSLATDDVLALVPPKDERSTKYRAGAVLVVGGAPGFAGAPLMCGLAALRAGAGVAWVVTPPEVAEILAGRQPELIVRPLPDGLDRLDRAGAIALGPGLGREEGGADLARDLVRRFDGPVVIDADGLGAFAGRLELLRRRRPPAVLTPHEGELARLLGTEPADVQAQRLEAVRRAARESGAVVLLKGPDTLVAEPGGERVTIAASSAYGLATAGSGDVLTGVVAAFLAKGLDPHDAAVAAAVAHGRAGALAEEALGPAGIIAGDVIDALPAVFRRA